MREITDSAERIRGQIPRAGLQEYVICVEPAPSSNC
jgi:predicted RNA-binding protein